METALLAPLAAAEVEFKIAELWRMRGKLERAERGLKRAIERCPAYLPPYLELIGMLERQQRCAEAIAVCREAMAHHPQAATLPQLLERLQAQASPAGEFPPLPGHASRQIADAPSPIRPHVLFYTDCWGTYGAEQINHTLMCELRAVGFPVSIAHGPASHHLIAAQRELGIAHLWLGDDSLYDRERAPRALSNPEEAERILASARPDIVIFSSGMPYSNLAAKEVTMRAGLPYLVLVHAPSPHWSQRFEAHRERLREVHSAARRVVTVSQDASKQLLDMGLLPRGKGTVIRNGVRAEFFEPPDAAMRNRLRDEAGIAPETIVVLTAARLSRDKGYHLLLSAAERLKPNPLWARLRFVWVGSGNYEARLRAVAESLGIAAHIRFLGERHDMPAVYDMADIFALPSLSENMPLSIIEAMAKGLPVLATATGGVAELLGTTGALLPIEDTGERELAGRISRTLERWAGDPGLRRSLGLAGRERVVCGFSAERMAREYQALIESSLA